MKKHEVFVTRDTLVLATIKRVFNLHVNSIYVTGKYFTIDSR